MRKKILLSALITGISIFTLCGCGKKDEEARLLDPNKPVSLTIWHYYNGMQQAAFDELVDEFNSTVGREKGIYIESYSQGSVDDLEQAIMSSVNGEIGSKELPDIFSSYSDTVFEMQQTGKVADLSQYFTEDELAAYVDGYVEEGRFVDEDSLYIFPTAKSTEIMMLNKTDWDVFSAECGVSTDDLSTVEGITRVAGIYYEWTDSLTPEILNDGKAFYGRDSMSNYFIIGMKQMGVEIFETDGGTAVINADKDKIRRLWDNYYVPYVKGWFGSYGRFRTDDVKTGDLLAYTGSSSSPMYFPDKVETENESYEIDYLVLPAPVMEGGECVKVQQGAGMAVTKSDELHEYASCVFLKWFTGKENNLKFACASAYLPVLKEANNRESIDEAIKSEAVSINSKAYDSFVSIMKDFDNTEFYSTKSFKNGYATRKVLDDVLSGRAVEDRQKIEEALAAGVTAEEALEEYLSDDYFDEWYADFIRELTDKAEAE